MKNRSGYKIHTRLQGGEAESKKFDELHQTLLDVESSRKKDGIKTLTKVLSCLKNESQKKEGYRTIEE